MEKLKSLLTSKKFWTLVAAIVAALTAFFTTSCAAQAKIRREGVHIDTVRVDYIIRSKNFQTLTSCSTIDQFGPILRRSTPKSCLSMSVSGTSTVSATIISFLPVTFSGFSTPQRISTLPDYNVFLSRSSSTRLISSITPTRSSSAMAPRFLSRPTCHIFGEKCLIALVPIAFLRRSRRGGRRGKGRPKGTKSIPIGGSHF